MPWADIPERTEAELKNASDRARIRAVVPVGWLRKQLRDLYDVELEKAGGDPIWGICGHDHVCVLAGVWRHPYPALPVCDDGPPMMHSGVTLR